MSDEGIVHRWYPELVGGLCLVGGPTAFIVFRPLVGVGPAAALLGMAIVSLLVAAWARYEVGY